MPERSPALLLFLLLLFLLPGSASADFIRTWTELNTTGEAPGILAEHSTILDPAGNRLIVFGGFVLEALDETYALDLATGVWTRIDASPRPPARFNHAAFYDAARRRMVVYGGTGRNLDPLSDVWALDLATDTWSQLDASGAPRRTRLATAVDPAGDRAFFFGGHDGIDFQATTLVMDLATGGVTSFTADVGPLARIGAIVTVDPDRDRLLLFGGNNFIDYFDDTWELGLSTGVWRQLAPRSHPTERAFMSGALDPGLGRWLFFGGNFGSEVFAETWSFDLLRDEWALLSVQLRPTRRNNFGLVLEPFSRRLILFGGNFLGALLDDVWVFTDPSFDSGSGALRFNGEPGAVDTRFVNGFPLRLEIQASQVAARYLLLADVGGDIRPTRVGGRLPFCFDFDPGSPTFSPGTVLICDTTGRVTPSSPLAPLLPPRPLACPPVAPAAPGLAVLVDETSVRFRVGLRFVLQAVIEDASRPSGFGSTPCVRVTVVP